MFRKFSSVPFSWVLAVIIAFNGICLQASQLWYSEPLLTHRPVTLVSLQANHYLSVDHCTVSTQSWEVGDKMAPSLTKEQNSVIKELYKCGRKIAHYQSHVYFLNESLKLNFIPKRFHIKNNLPGNKSETQKQLDIASFISIKCEKCDYEIKLQNTIGEFEHLKHRLNNLFTPSAVIVETKRLEKHLKKVENAKKKVVLKKIKRDFNPSFNVNDVVADRVEAMT